MSLMDMLPKYYDSSAIVSNIMAREDGVFDQLSDDFADVLDQYFIDTATWGLSYWERVLQIPTDEAKPYDQRRSVIKSKLRGVGTVNAALIKNVAESYDNGTVDVTDYLKNELPPFSKWTLYNKATSLNNFAGKIKTETTNFVDKVKTETLNYVGKISGSNVENANKFKYYIAGSALGNPTSNGFEDSTPRYNDISTLNGVVTTATTATSGNIAQQIFSFDLIAMMQRKYGMTVDATWLKANVKSLLCNWYGFGSGPNSYNASLAHWKSSDSSWKQSASSLNTGSTIKKTSTGTGYVGTTTDMMIDSNGFCHFLAYADAASSTIPSVLNTDYVELVVDIGGIAFNPNMGFAGAGSSLPSPVLTENFTDYTKIATLNGTPLQTNSTVTNGYYAYHRFSFDLIALIKNRYGLTVDVAWLKVNVKNLVCNWHGFGSGPNGNKAYLDRWKTTTNSWYVTGVSTSSSAVARLQLIPTVSESIDDNGFFHAIAYADTASSTVASTINTDYVELIVDIGGTTWNPNTAKANGAVNSLQSPLTGTWSEFSSAFGYPGVNALNGQYATTISPLTAGNIAQQLFSFDLISIIERKYNTVIPGSTIADKVTWLKANVTKLTCNWHGFGSGPNGNKATMARFSPRDNVYYAGLTTTNSTVTKLAGTISSSMDAYIDNSGFHHVIAYADASNGTIASTINTDYIELIVEANVVNGVTVSDAVVDPVNPYKLTLNASLALENNTVRINVSPNTTYTFSSETGGFWGAYYDGSGVWAGNMNGGVSFTSSTFTTAANVYSIELRTRNDNTGTSVYTNPNLNRGNIKLPFNPQKTYTIGITFVSNHGIPENLQDIQDALREIIPAHLAIDFIFTYMTWSTLNSKGFTWGTLNGQDFTWEEFESLK